MKLKNLLMPMLIGASTWAIAQDNQSLFFDGFNDYVEINNLPISGSGDFTIELQIKKGASLNTNLFQTYSGSTETFDLRYTSDEIILTTPLGDINTGTAIEANVYTNLAIVRNGATTTIYKNGMVIGSGDVSYSLGSLLRLGSFPSSPNGNSFNGEMDELRIWSFAKTANQILRRPCFLLGSELGLVGYYDFNEGTPGADNSDLNTLVDKSVSLNDGDVKAFQYSITTSDWVSSTFSCLPEKETNNSLFFDGFNDYVEINELPITGSGDFTIELQIKKGSSVNTNLFQTYSGSTETFDLRYTSDEIILTTPLGDINTGTAIEANVYTNLAIVRNGATTTIYKNGMVIGSGDVSYSLGSLLRLGSFPSSPNGNSFNGEMDELRIWSFAKTGTQISNSTCYLSGNESGLVGYYDFEEGTPGADNSALNTLVDKSISLNDGEVKAFQYSITTSDWVASSYTCGTVTGLFDYFKTDSRESIKVYPNPFIETIETSLEDVTSMQLFNLNGQLVQESNNTNTLNINTSVSNGCYILRVIGSETYTYKVIKK